MRVVLLFSRENQFVVVVAERFVSRISVVRYLGQLLVPFFEPCCPAHSVLCAIVVIVLVLS